MLVLGGCLGRSANNGKLIYHLQCLAPARGINS